MTDILTTPGVLTDAQMSTDRARWLKLHGVEWVSVQAQNGTIVKTRDLAPLKAAGLSAGIWGVSYGAGDAPNADAFRRDGQLLGARAVLMGADHVIADIEMAAKDTRASRGLEPYLDGIRRGGWLGPVHLCPLGAPVNALPHGGNDFAIDVEGFLETGGGVLPQAYFNAYDEYRPDLCVDYWRACGVPMDKINVTVAVYAGEGKGGRISGAEWVPLLRDADVYRNLSIYMDEFLMPFDMEGLHPLTLGPPRPTEEEEPVTVDPAAVNLKIAALAETWLAENSGDEPLTRLRNIKRIATTSDAKWTAVRDDVRAALDGGVSDLRNRLGEAEHLVDSFRTRAGELQLLLDAANAKIAAAKTALS